MEYGDSDAEMVDYGTDFADDVDPNFDDAKARASTLATRIHCRSTPLVLLLQLDVLRVYELIINSPSCRLQYGRLPYVALAFLGRQASNAASEGCHSTGQLVMSDKQTTMSNDTLEKIVCLRNSRTAVATGRFRLPLLVTWQMTAACSLSRTLNRSRMLPVRALA